MHSHKKYLLLRYLNFKCCELPQCILIFKKKSFLKEILGFDNVDYVHTCVYSVYICLWLSILFYLFMAVQ